MPAICSIRVPGIWPPVQMKYLSRQKWNHYSNTVLCNKKSVLMSYFWTDSDKFVFEVNHVSSNETAISETTIACFFGNPSIRKITQEMLEILFEETLVLCLNFQEASVSAVCFYLKIVQSKIDAEWYWESERRQSESSRSAFCQIKLSCHSVKNMESFWKLIELLSERMGSNNTSCSIGYSH